MYSYAEIVANFAQHSIHFAFREGYLGLGIQFLTRPYVVLSFDLINTYYGKEGASLKFTLSVIHALIMVWKIKTTFTSR